jgi:RimJ/RimL family protein N-acetyltransferase
MQRLAAESDFDFIYHLYMHPVINPWLLYEMMNEQEFRPIFDELVKKNCLFVFHTGAERIGMFKLVPQKYRNSHIVYLGGIGIHPQYRGKGYGSVMLGEVISYVKSSGFQRIELTVASSNSQAIRMYEKAGFRNEGTLRKYSYLKSEDRFIDEQVMALLL